jgi:hypothetical protein
MCINNVPKKKIDGVLVYQLWKKKTLNVQQKNNVSKYHVTI